MPRPCFLHIACALALLACAESNVRAPMAEAEPSPLVDEPAIERIAPACAEGTSTDVALDETTEAGFSAEDVLAYVEGEHREALRWAEIEDVRIAPEAGESELIIRVERASTRAKALDPDTDAIGHGARCRPWLSVAVTVTLQGAGGAFNDRFDATLFATYAGVAYLRATTPALELAGELQVERERTGIEAASYELSMTFSEHGVTGRLESHWSIALVAPELSWTETLELAHFGRARCDDPAAYAVALDERIELWGQTRISAAQTIEALHAHGPFELAWEGGDTTTATISFEPAEAGGCAAAYVLSPEDSQDLGVRGELTVRSEDGRLDARWPGHARPNGFEDGRVTGASFSLDPLAMPDSFTVSAAELGFPLERRGEHTSLQAQCVLLLNEEAEDSGFVELTAYDDNSGCDYGVDPTCVGSLTRTPLAHGMILP